MNDGISELQTAIDQVDDLVSNSVSEAEELKSQCDNLMSELEELESSVENLQDALADLKDELIKQGERIKVHPIAYRCPECQAVYVGKANYGKHLEEDHSYGEEAIYVDMENQQIYYDTGKADLERLLEEYTNVRIDA